MSNMTDALSGLSWSSLFGSSLDLGDSTDYLGNMTKNMTNMTNSLMPDGISDQATSMMAKLMSDALEK